MRALKNARAVRKATARVPLRTPEPSVRSLATAPVTERRAPRRPWGERPCEPERSAPVYAARPVGRDWCVLGMRCSSSGVPAPGVGPRLGRRRLLPLGRTQQPSREARAVVFRSWKDFSFGVGLAPRKNRAGSFREASSARARSSERSIGSRSREGGGGNIFAHAARVSCRARQPSRRRSWCRGGSRSRRPRWRAAPRSRRPWR